MSVGRVLKVQESRSNENTHTHFLEMECQSSSGILDEWITHAEQECIKSGGSVLEVPTLQGTSLW